MKKALATFVGGSRNGYRCAVLAGSPYVCLPTWRKQIADVWVEECPAPAQEASDSETYTLRLVHFQSGRSVGFYAIETMPDDVALRIMVEEWVPPPKAHH